MQYVSFQLVDFVTGAGIPNGRCAVYVAGTSTLASLYDSGGSPISNPAVASSLAQVGFAAANGTYDFQPQYADGTVAGPRIINQQLMDATNVLSVITPLQYGAVGNGTHDDGAAFVAAIAASRAAAISGYGYGSLAGPRVFVPKGVYWLNTTTLDLTHAFIFEGESYGLSGGGSTVLKWADGTTGIRTQSGNTTGATGVQTTVARAGQALIRNMLLYGAYTGTESESHGIHMRVSCAVENVGIYNFSGDGVHIVATAGSGGAFEGNDNTWFLKRVFTQNCRNGVFVDGADTNAGNAHACYAIGNRRWNFWDSSFLGNTWIGCGADNGGLVVGSTQTVVTYSGNRYCVVKDQGVGASTHAPSGTTSDNAYWYYVGAGGVDSVNNILTWVSGTTYRDGGSFRCDDSNAGSVFIGSYAEGGQGFAQIDGPALAFGKSMGNKGVPVIDGFGNNFRVPGNAIITGSTNLEGSDNFVWGNLYFSPAGANVARFTCTSTRLQVSFGSAASFSVNVDFVGEVLTADKSGLNLKAGMPLSGSDTAAPTSGTWTRGQMILNALPSAGGKIGWVCVTGGTPGTWKPFGAIDV